MKTAAVLAVAVITNSLANVCLSKGMKQYGGSRPLGVVWLLETSRHVVSNGWLIAGVLFLLVFLASYLTALSWADLSFVLPATAPAYLLTAGFSKYFLHESISPNRWAGTLLIVAGTFFVAQSYSAPSSENILPDEVGLGLPPAAPESAEPDGSVS